MVDQSQINELIVSFLNTPDDEEENTLLAEIVDRHVRPILRQIIVSRFRWSTGGLEAAAKQDVEDIVADVVLQLLKRLMKAKAAGDNEAISDLTSYVSVAAHNAFYGYLRQKHPHRRQISEKIRYVLRYHDAFAVWLGARGRSLCGLVEWRDLKLMPGPMSRVRKLIDSLESVAPEVLDHGHDKSLLPELLQAIFDVAEGPIELSDLVSIVTKAWTITGVYAAAPEESIQTGLQRDPQDPGMDQFTVLEQREYLKAVWLEIAQLPLPQRSALLLNLVDENGQSLTAFFVDSKAATLSQLAAALELTEEEFIELSRDLPMQDLDIAIRLGIRRQQVINLRVAAKRRLARRLERSLPKTKSQQPN